MERNALIPSISRRLAVLCLLAAAPAHAGDLQARLTAFVGTAGTATLDPRLVRDCPQPPVIDWYGSVRRSVVVACAGQPGWRVFVPVRSVAGAPTQNFLTPVVVKRGDPVQIHAGGAGFRVTTVGAAEQDGRVGAHIRVRNPATGTVTAAIVESAGNVSLPGYNSASASR